MQFYLATEIETLSFAERWCWPLLRPSGWSWPSAASWAQLKDAVGGNLLADALFAASRHKMVRLHTSKGLADAAPEALLRSSRRGQRRLERRRIYTSCLSPNHPARRRKLFRIRARSRCRRTSDQPRESR
jgi:hypothetical protein